MDRRRDKNLIVEPNAAMPGENIVKKNPGLVNIAIGGEGEKRAALRSSAIICFPQRIKERKGVVNCRMK